MFTTDAKNLARMAPTLKRVLIVDPNATAAKLLAESLKGLGVGEVVHRAEGRAALDVCRDFEPTLIFTEYKGQHLEGDAFARAVRRSNLACRKVPIIMITAEATAASILGARDSGVHEFLRKPYTSGDLTKRVEVVSLKPRNWIEAVGYVGPDRRRFNSGEYAGPKTRTADAAATRGPAADAAAKDQAMRILASAHKQFDTDPMQALRAIREQTSTLRAMAMKTSDTGLVIATSGLEKALAAGQPTMATLAQPVAAVVALAAPETLAELAA